MPAKYISIVSGVGLFHLKEGDAYSLTMRTVDSYYGDLDTDVHFDSEYDLQYRYGAWNPLRS